MTGRLKLIEQKLIAIDSAVFQDLCDTYLSLRMQEFISFNKTGSQLGEQKTIKGTPDTFFRLSDGSLRYVEYTTINKGLVKKIKSDIVKCLDSTKTKVPIDEVRSITICFNRRLSPSQEREIIEYATEKRIGIKLIGIDTLATEIYSKHLTLAKDFLGIPIDTGQVLPLENFIAEYNNKAGKLSTPIDNVFLNRENEIQSALQIFNENDLLIITGASGVGKTKFAMQTIIEFTAEQKNFTPFCISKKDVDIWEDLKIYLQQDQDYILFVDDVNRQLPNFRQILGVFRETRKGKLKIILTVRDYAYKDVRSEIDYEIKKIELKKFGDDEITKIISSDSFKILNPRFQRRILELSDGNARVAIMCARLGDNLFYENIFELYDTYFQTFIKDFDIFSDKVKLKTIGIISFFFSIDKTDKELIETILQDFDLTRYQFEEAINELHKRELVEVQYDIVRISEQIMSTYFFYKVFIKDKLLSFKKLLFNYFEKYSYRIKESTIATINSFTYKDVFSEINNDLASYMDSIYNDDKKMLAFLKVFWFYKQEETLAYYLKEIQDMPLPQNPIYEVSEKYDSVSHSHNDETFVMLGEFLFYYTNNFFPAIELLFEYVRRKPSEITKLVKLLKDRIAFTEEDSNYLPLFQRQVELFKLLNKKFSDGQSHYIKTYFPLATEFLKHNFRTSRLVRNNVLTTSFYPIPLSAEIKKFRKQIFELLINNYCNYPLEVFQVFEKYINLGRDVEAEVLNFDFPYILSFFKNKLDDKNFKHIVFVREFIYWLNGQSALKDRSYKILAKKFNSNEYETYQKLDWDYRKGKWSYEAQDHNEFEKLKEQDIRKSFTFQDTQEFNSFYQAIKNIISLKNSNTWWLHNSLEIVFEENFLQNKEIGFLLITGLLKSFSTEIYPLYRAINLIANSNEEYCKRFWNFLEDTPHDYIINWKIEFLERLSPNLISKYYTNKLLDTINAIKSSCIIKLELFDKYQIIDKKIIEKILCSINTKNEIDDLKIIFYGDFFEQYATKYRNHIDWLCKAYLYQEKVHDHFDFERKGLKNILEIYPEFLLEFVREFYGNNNIVNRNIHRDLSLVWDMNSFTLMEKVIDIFIEKSLPYLDVDIHEIGAFFQHLNESEKENVNSFAYHYVENYYQDTKKMEVIFDVVRHFLNEKFEELLLLYLRKNSNLISFKKIQWIERGHTIINNSTTFGDIEASDWQRIYSILEKAENQLEIIPIKSYVKKRIESSLEYAEYEHKRRFQNPDR